MPRDRVTERANRRNSRYLYKLNEEYDKIVKAMDIEKSEITPPPWCKPESNSSWNGNFKSHIRSSGF